jgi:hypothetical protein
MLGKAFPKCKSGSALAAAVEGTIPRASDAEVKVAASDEIATESAAKRVKKRRAGRAADQMPESEGDTGGYDNEEMAEKAETAASLPGTTFATVSEDATVSADQADLARVTGEVADPDAQQKQQVATVLPVQAGMPTDLPFKVKTPGDTQDGQVVVASVQSSWNIQLGAYPTKKAAQDALYKARGISPKLFADKQAYTVEVKKGEETIFRARMSGFTAKTAKRACKALSRKKVDCATMAPQG